MIKCTEEYIVCEHEGKILHYSKRLQCICKATNANTFKTYPYEYSDVIYAKLEDSECAKEFIFEIAKYRSKTFDILKSIKDI